MRGVFGLPEPFVGMNVNQMNQCRQRTILVLLDLCIRFESNLNIVLQDSSVAFGMYSVLSKKRVFCLNY